MTTSCQKKKKLELANFIIFHEQFFLWCLKQFSLGSNRSSEPSNYDNMFTKLLLYYHIIRSELINFSLWHFEFQCFFSWIRILKIMIRQLKCYRSESLVQTAIKIRHVLTVGAGFFTFEDAIKGKSGNLSMILLMIGLRIRNKGDM